MRVYTRVCMRVVYRAYIECVYYPVNGGKAIEMILRMALLDENLHLL